MLLVNGEVIEMMAGMKNVMRRCVRYIISVIVVELRRLDVY